MSAGTNETRGGRQPPHERCIVRILRARPAGTGAPTAKEGGEYAYLWRFAARRLRDGNWRENEYGKGERKS